MYEHAVQKICEALVKYSLHCLTCLTLFTVAADDNDVQQYDQHIHVVERPVAVHECRQRHDDPAV